SPMRVEQEHLITGEEAGGEWRRLAREKVPEDAPEYQAFLRRLQERDDYLFERYGKPYLETDPGRWIAISFNGEVLIRDTAGEASWAGDESFGPGNFIASRLPDFRGRKL